MVRLQRTAWKGSQPLKTQPLPLQADKIQYNLHQGELQSKDSPRIIGFLIVAPEVPDTIEVPGRQTKIFIFKTFLNYTNALPIPEISGHWPNMKSSIRETSRKVIDLLSTPLQRFHTELWKKLWNHGFGISLSKAQQALNGDVINGESYYGSTKCTLCNFSVNSKRR